MKMNEAKAIVEALVTIRNAAADEQALKVPALYPKWREGVSYKVGERVVYEDTLYRVLTDHTSQGDWTPGMTPSLFGKVLVPDPETIPEWEQPESTNPYQKGDKVRHNGKNWVSDTDQNVWEPGVYGWSEVTS